MRPAQLILCSVAAGSLLTGCEVLHNSDSVIGQVTPYRIDIVQGNAVTKEQVALVKPGQSRLQVRDVLGTPLLTDPFHANRWDYIFMLRRPGANAQPRSVVVWFEGDVVKSIDAPELPSERDFVDSIRRHDNRAAPRLELSDDEIQALPLPPKREPPPIEPVGAVREYPPLEKS